MSKKRECPPSFTPPPTTMPWMRAGTQSLLSRVTGSPGRSQLLQNIPPSSIPQPEATQGEAERTELANIVR